jgi:hypothetical protein
VNAPVNPDKKRSWKLNDSQKKALVTIARKGGITYSAKLAKEIGVARSTAQDYIRKFSALDLVGPLPSGISSRKFPSAPCALTLRGFAVVFGIVVECAPPEIVKDRQTLEMPLFRFDLESGLTNEDRKTIQEFFKFVAELVTTNKKLLKAHSADLSPIKDYFDSIHKTWMFGYLLHKAFSGKLDFYLSIRPEMFRHCFFRHILLSILEERGLDLSQKEEVLKLLLVNKEIREIIVDLLERIKYYKELEGILQKLKFIQSFSEEPRPLSDEVLKHVFFRMLEEDMLELDKRKKR